MTDTVTRPEVAVEEPSEKGRGARRSGGRRSPRGAAASSPSAAAVNLLSPWVLEENRVRTLRLRFLGAAVAVILVVGLTLTALHLRISGRQNDLQAQEAVGAQLQGQIGEMAAVRSYAADVKRRTTVLAEAMATEVTFSRALIELQDLLPPETTVDTFAGATSSPVGAEGQPPAEEGLCPGPDPFGATTIVGCVALSGLAPSREAVSRLVQALSQSEVFVEPFISTTTTDDQDIVAFSGSVGLAPELLSGRFALPGTEPATGSTAPAPDAGATS